MHDLTLFIAWLWKSLRVFHVVEIKFQADLTCRWKKNEMVVSCRCEACSFTYAVATNINRESRNQGGGKGGKNGIRMRLFRKSP